MIVVDTNIIAYLYISGEHSSQSESLLSLSSDWCAPLLWRSEFRSVLSLYLRKNILSLDEVLLIIQQAEHLMRGNEYEIPSAHVMQLVDTSDCSAYDCEFIALAQHLQIPLVTADSKLLRSFPKIARSLQAFVDG